MTALIWVAVCLWGLATLVAFVGAIALALRADPRQPEVAPDWCDWNWPSKLRDRPTGGCFDIPNRNGGDALTTTGIGGSSATVPVGRSEAPDSREAA